MKLSHVTMLKCILLIVVTSVAHGEQNLTVNRLTSRIVGITLPLNDPLYHLINAKLEQGDYLAAAQITTELPEFYNVTLRNWVAPWSSVNGNVLSPLDDMQATAIGLVRDREDFRKLLTGTKFYKGDSQWGFREVSAKNNNHYIDVEASYLSLKDVLVAVDREDDRSIGIFGSRGFAQAFYSEGTNRRAVKFALKNFLCAEISTWRESLLPDDFVRRDVNRFPSGNHREYQVTCRGCHAPMDALSGAFAEMDFKDGQLYISASQVQPKFNLHPDVFPEGYEVKDGHWVNYLARSQNGRFGWRGHTSGDTLEAFARMLADSKAFSQCLVQRAIQHVCSVSSSKKVSFVQRLASQLESTNYDMRLVFELAAIDPDCN